MARPTLVVIVDFGACWFGGTERMENVVQTQESYRNGHHDGGFSSLAPF
jgi:hypothetical protein